VPSDDEVVRVAEMFADLARPLAQSDDVQTILDRIVEEAVSQLHGCSTPEGTVALADHVGRGEGVGMRRGRRLVPVVSEPTAFAGFRFPPEVIVLAVRWYLRFGLSYRDLEELLAERGVEVDHVTLYQWVQRPRSRTTAFVRARSGPLRPPVSRWIG
jgi:hypothetical protein